MSTWAEIFYIITVLFSNIINKLQNQDSKQIDQTHFLWLILFLKFVMSMINYIFYNPIMSKWPT